MHPEPHTLVPKGPIRDLLYGYDIILREMSTWQHGPTAACVQRLREDQAKFAQAMTSQEPGEDW